jgi:3-methyladenine DNA glycosylase AlkD
VIRTLRGWREPARAEGVQRYFKHAVAALGIETPKLRAFVADLLKTLKPSWSAEQAIDLGERLEAAYEVVREHLGDPEDLIHKAVGWLLRECGKTDMKRLRRFLLRHGSEIPRTTLRYAIERFPAAQRARLLRVTRRKSNR